MGVTRNPAAEIARLANIALAEVGHPECVYPDPTDEYPAAVEFVGGDDATLYRAVSLAALHVNGPSHETYCPAHPTDEQGGDRCARVPVRDALLGRTCGVTP